MTHRFCYIFPGQGAQYVGMGKSFYDSYAIAKETFQEADDTLHLNLSKTIFSGPEDALTATRTAQPAIFVVSCAILRTLKQHFALPAPICVAGLSLGEYTALSAAGIIPYKDALSLVALRGACMHDACEKTKGGMLVLLGLSDEEVKSLPLPEDVWCANFNCPGQVVLSGTIKGLEKAKSIALQNGARKALPLQVHGAFHSGLMQEAQIILEKALSTTKFEKSAIHCAMNVTGSFCDDPEVIRSNLAKQVCSSVLWHACIHTCEGVNLTHFIEIGCGKTLAGLNKRIAVSVPTLSIETVDDIPSLEPLLK
jgi:[acyl-carrier-protein] S-malonyltransferase